MVFQRRVGIMANVLINMLFVYSQSIRVEKRPCLSFAIINHRIISNCAMVVRGVWMRCGGAGEKCSPAPVNEVSLL